MYKIIFFTFTLMCSFNINYAQGTGTYDAAKIQSYLNEVFAGPECAMYTGSEYVNMYLQYYSRISIEEVSDLESITFSKLSEIDLSNKCNADLQYDNASNFDPNNFNAMKYLISFHPNTVEKYNVDGTNYIITVIPE